MWWIVLGLGIGPAVSNGFARFSYGLLLPSMQADLDWSYTQAGWINTANAIGYLAGALLALTLVGRIGPRRLFVFGMLLTTLALAWSATTRDLGMLSFWRIVAGIGGAPVFIAGGVIASGLFQDRRKNALAIALYFGSGGAGMVVTGLGLPLFLDWFGQAGWPLAWLGLAVMCYVIGIPACRAAAMAPRPRATDRVGRRRLPVSQMLPALIAYFAFGAGYIVYITFLVAWMGSWDASPLMIAATWCVMGCAVIVSSFVWRSVLERAETGGAIALTVLATGLGVALPLIAPHPAVVLASAALFGVSFFQVPSAITAFSRLRAFPFIHEAYPAALKKFQHSSGVKRSQISPMASMS